MAHTLDHIETGRRLEGKRVIVLGGSSGIGYAVAQRAVAEGASVVVASGHAGRARSAASELGGDTRGEAVDLSDERAIRAFFNAAGPFDHLVYTAGDSLQLSELSSMDLSTAEKAFGIRYWGALAAVKYAAQHIGKGGSIVLTTGIAALRPRAGWALAASVCGAVEALTRALAVELAPLRVNAVSPGLIATNLWKNMSRDARQTMYEQAARNLPVGRVGEAHDVAAAYLFLMESGFASGQTYVVDGAAVLV